MKVNTDIIVNYYNCNINWSRSFSKSLFHSFVLRSSSFSNWSSNSAYYLKFDPLILGDIKVFFYLIKSCKKSMSINVMGGVLAFLESWLGLKFVRESWLKTPVVIANGTTKCPRIRDPPSPHTPTHTHT